MTLAVTVMSPMKAPISGTSVLLTYSTDTVTRSPSTRVATASGAGRSPRRRPVRPCLRAGRDARRARRLPRRQLDGQLVAHHDDCSRTSTTACPTTQPLVFVFVALIAFVMLLISIRSVFLALKGVLMTVLSVAAAYGSLVVVFQWGWLEALGFEPLASLDSTIPPLVLAMTFGLSMDYEIFLLTRIRERFLQTNNTRDAVAYGVSTSARTITSAALIMIAVFVGFAFAGMPLVAQLGVACAVAIAVDATVVRLVLVPALMAMFAQWNWWLPRWLDRILPSVDFEKPLPKVDIGDLVIIPEDISALGPSGADIRMVVKSAAKLKNLAPQTHHRGRPAGVQRLRGRRAIDRPASRAATRPLAKRASPATRVRPSTAHTGGAGPGATGNAAAGAIGHSPAARFRRAGAPGDGVARPARGGAGRAGHRRRRATARPCERLSPMETTNVLLPTGDRLQIPTGAETLRLKSYLIMCRNSARDFAEFADLVDVHGDPHRSGGAGRNGPVLLWSTVEQQWVATQLVRRLADPHPSDDDDDATSDPDAEADWAQVRQRCLSVAVAMLEEAR